MTGYTSRPSDGRTGDTFFEQELVTALNDFANTTPAPSFDATGIQRRTRRRRSGLIATVAVAVAVAGGGTALATVGGSSSSSVMPAATSASAASDAATLLVGKYRTEMAGMHPDDAKGQLLKNQLKLGTVGTASPANCKPGSVIGVSPHSPTSVSKGDTVSLTLCAVPTDTSEVATLLVGKYKTNLAGLRLDDAKGQLLKNQLKLGAVIKASPADCKPGSVLEVSPHSPQSVTKGATISLTVCAG